MKPNVRNRLERLEAYADLIKEHVTVLRKELADSGVSKNSARKGKVVISEKEKAKIIAKRQKARMKKTTQ